MVAVARGGGEASNDEKRRDVENSRKAVFVIQLPSREVADAEQQVRRKVA